MSGSAIATSAVVNEHAWHVPAPGLQDFVDSYVGYRQAGVGPARHRGLPSPAMTLIFTLDDPLAVEAHPDGAQPSGTFETLIGGLHATPAIITHNGSQSGIQLGLSPLGARMLLGMPAAELAGIDVPAEDVLGPMAAEVQDMLRCATTWPERFAVLDETLLARAGQACHQAGAGNEVTYAWRSLLRTGGTVAISELAAGTGWSDRHLRARFRAETGLAPKAAARVIRFDRARRQLQRRASTGQPLQLAELAASCGYFDQAHLDRDFGLLAGCAPTSWLAEEFRNFQASTV